MVTRHLRRPPKARPGAGPEVVALVFLTGLQLTFAVLLLALSLLLMPRYGLTGVGVAWLAIACALALSPAATAPRWLTTDHHRWR
ncbi:hypothetical protein [Kitasatospora sp. NPDC085879]|uniref:hypothetical protein n=1 Tax=Kitasatospora sp. NPDC085879 TaxID=3154769 RepID=UPI003443CFDB